MPQPPAVPEDIRVDALLVGRYRLQGRRAEGPRSTLWRAKDEVLARAVAVKVVGVRGKRRPRAGDEPTFAAINAAAATAGRLSDPRFVRVLDVVDAGRVALVISEWVDAPPLSNVLREGPLPPLQAADIASQVAAALAGVARSHGRLHPRNVLVLPDGDVKITDYAVAAAIHDSDGDDVAGVGGLLYAGLTATWPGCEDVGLPPAPRTGTRVRRPRQLRAAVPREVDQACLQLLEHGDPPAVDVDMTGAAALLDSLPHERLGTPPAGAPLRGDRRWRRWLTWTAALAGLAVVGGTCWAIGTSIGRVPGGPQFPTYTTPTGKTGAHGHPVVLGPLLGKVRDFDPEGDHEEDPGEVDAAVDGQPHNDDTTSAWSTDRYNSAAFGGLKSGVGLIVDFGRPTRVSSVHLVLTTPGANVQLRAANTPGTAAADFPVVATARQAAQQTTLSLAHPVTERYWVLWFTRLPASRGGYQEGVADLVFLA